MSETPPTETVTIDVAAVRRARNRVRVKFPLVAKLFLLTTILVAIVVGVTFGVTLRRADQVATRTVDAAIARAADLFDDLESRRLRMLRLGALATTRDSSFHAYVEKALRPGAEPVGEGFPLPETTTTSGVSASQVPAEPQTTEAPPSIDTASILNLLQQKRELLGSDLLILADDQGIVVSRTDQIDLTRVAREDLYESQPLLREMVENPPPPDPDSGTIEPLTGAIALGSGLYHVAIVPMSIGGRPPIGYLINAYSIDETFANQIAAATSTGVVFVPAAAEGMTAPRSTNAPSAANLRAMPEVASLLSTGKMIPPHSVKIDQSRYVMTGEALRSFDKPVGAAIFVRSLDTELAPFHEIERTLLLAGLIVLPLAFLLSWLIAKRLTRPVEDLAEMAQAVSEGDYAVQPDTERSDEVGILARSFASMISALRDKQELEELYAEMAGKVKEREERAAAVGGPFEEPHAETGTILVTDLRGFQGALVEGDATSVIQKVSEAMKIQEAEVLRQDGRVREIVGHQLICSFGGDRGMIHAIRAARAITEELSRYAISAGVGVATGEYVAGSVDLSSERGTAFVGSAPLLALLLAWEAPNGHAFVSLETAQTIGTEVLEAGAREEVQLRWLPAPLPVISLPLLAISPGLMKTYGSGDLAMMKTLALDTGAQVLTPRSELVAGSLFATRYEIEQVIGRGGMGVVYRALDRQLDETVAIKTLMTDMMASSPEQLERFKREIRLARKITHRNVLRTYDYGEANGIYFISMEFVRGYTLAELLEETPSMALRGALGIARQMCRGLQAAHEQGIIHRDIKPQNVLIDHRGEAKLMDFGIARMTEAPESMTQAGMIVGTPHYMSPEQVQGKTLDPRTDVYSVGVLLYEMLCGKRPFESSSLTGVLAAHIAEMPRPPIEHRPELGSEVNAIVLRCLAKDPVHRYANAAELLRELDRLQAVVAA